MVVRFRWSAPPERETRFELPAGIDYEREFLQCPRCAHLVAETGIDPDVIYGGGYVDATYSGAGIMAAYERIMSLPEGSSDNLARVERVDSHMVEVGSGDRTVLDVGSGLGVFGARMKERGWRVTALDPDARAAEHTREVVGVEAVEADYMSWGTFERYALVTLNKVLEHVADPTAMLARTAQNLDAGGRVYIEVPDGELAAEHGPGREEFFIEHLHAFSFASIGLLAQRAGFLVERVERLHEPSDKFTLAAFLRAGAVGD